MHSTTTPQPSLLTHALTHLLTYVLTCLLARWIAYLLAYLHPSSECILSDRSFLRALGSVLGELTKHRDVEPWLHELDRLLEALLDRLLEASSNFRKQHARHLG